MDDLLREFLTESAESLTVVDGELVKLERDPNNKDVLSRIFRLVHTIKGTCGFIGLPRLEKVAHISENLLGKFRDGELSVTPGAVTLILESLDRIKEILAQLEETGTEPAGDDSALLGRLERAVAGEPVDGDAPAPAAAAPVQVAAEAPQPEAEPGEAEHAEAAPAPAAAAKAEAPAAAAAQAGGAKGESVANQSIRVNVDVIENLMVMVSELVLTRNQLLEMVRHLNDSEFKVPLQRLSNVTADLQEGVVKTRMQPIGNAWQKLPRIVRDLSQELRKKMDLQMFGAETELDRQVLELIKDPLTHMIRNSADHGLETPAERKAAGKSETGVITLKAYHEGGHIIIEVGDDGKGLPTEKIRAKAVANGIVTEAEAAKLSDQQVHRFIFHAGLSTASAVTNVSGRGVGMDVVRSNIELIGGSVDLKSVQGQGTKFTIKIPLTLAIMSALIVGVRDQRFAIPQVCVLELVRAGRGSEARIERINRTPVLRLRNRLLPLVTLSEILSVSDQPSTAKAEEAFIVIAQAGGRSFGIVVDSVFDTGEIVVKPLAQALKGVSMFSGNTILGDGSVIMILDPNGVASAVAGETAARGGSEETRATSSASEQSDVQALLLFRAGSQEPKAVPLSLVTRLEMVEAARIERSDGRLVLQYRGNLVPLVTFDMGQQIQSEGRQPVLVFTDGDRTVGMAVDEILDIVDATLNLELAGNNQGTLGTAVVRGKATEVVDISSCVGDAFRNGFVAKPSKKSAAAANRRKILFVDDSPFFRTLMAPLLAAAGYQVTEAPNAEAALTKMKEEGKAFDLILSDIDMPGMGGHAFAKAIKNDPNYGSTPVVGLASEDAHEEPGTFDAVTQKFDRDNVIATIRSYMDVRSAA